MSTLSHDARTKAEAAERAARRAAFRAGPHYPKWQRARQVQLRLLRRSLDDGKPFFDLMRSVLLTGLLAGLLGAAMVSGQTNEHGEPTWSWSVLPVGLFTLLSLAYTWAPAKHFAIVMAVDWASDNFWPFRGPRGSVSALVVNAGVGAVFLLTTVCMVVTGYTVAEQGYSRAKSVTLVGKP